MGNTMTMQLCRSLVVLCPTRVGEMSDSRRCQGLKGTRFLSLESRGVSRLGLRLSLLEIVYEPTGVLGVFTVCGTSEVAGHVCWLNLEHCTFVHHIKIASVTVLHAEL